MAMRRRRIVLWSAAIALAGAFVLYAIFWPCWIEPVAWTPDPNPGLTGAFAPNHALARVTALAPGADGPEDVELGPDGWMYASMRGASSLSRTAIAGFWQSRRMVACV